MIKDVKGYEGYYTISKTGIVWSLVSGKKRGVIFKRKQPRIVKSQVGPDGYVQITLTKDTIRKTHRLHRLVALTFLENPNNYPEINHKDENKLNNSVLNLEWCTSKYNTNYGTGNQRRRIKERAQDWRFKPVVQCDLQGIEIRVFKSIREASKQTNIAESQISKCARNIKQFKSAGGYKWKLK